MRQSRPVRGIWRNVLFAALVLGTAVVGPAGADQLLPPIGLAAGQQPWDVAVHASGACAYAITAGGFNSAYLIVIDTASGGNHAIALPQVGAAQLATSPNGQWLYVMDGVNSAIRVYQTVCPGSVQLVTTIPVYAGPQDVVFDSSSTWAFVSSANATDSVVHVIQVATHTVSRTIPVHFNVRGVVAVDVPQRGLQVYAAINSVYPEIAVIDGTSPNWPVRYFPVGQSAPTFLAANAEGTKVYATAISRVHVIRTANDAVSTIFVANGVLQGIDVTPIPGDQERVYVSDGGNGSVVWRINAVTDTLLPGFVDVGKSPRGIAALPNGSKVYVARSGIAPPILEVIGTEPE